MKLSNTKFVVLLLLAPSLHAQTVANSSEDSRPPIVLTDQARAIHRRALLIDGHNDLPWELRSRGVPTFEKTDLSKPQPELHTDIPRLRLGGMGAQFWSVWVPASTSYQGTSLSTTLEQIDLVHAMITRYPQVFELALTADDIERIAGKGKIASLIGVEGGHSIENSLSVLHRLYDLGARYMTLTHSDTLDWADSATDKARHGGLTPFGEEVVREMNRLGMMVDISHVSPATMKQTLRITEAPVIFSHSSARAIADHSRNVPDDVLKRMAENGGVVMVNFYSSFIVPEAAEINVRQLEHWRVLQGKYDSEEKIKSEVKRWRLKNPRPRGTIHNVLDHIDHIAKVAGVDHVGIGSDFDGVSMLPEQMDDVSCYPLITQGLLDLGYNEEQIHKILGGNLLRVFRQVEQTAKRLRGN